MDKNKIMLVQAITLLVFLLIVTAIFLYHNGVYDISFIERNEDTPSEKIEIDITAEEGSPSDIPQIENAETDNISQIHDESSESSLSYAENMNRLALTSDLAENGYNISDEIYTSENFELALVLDSVPLPTYFNKSFPNTVVIGSPALYPYMGYIMMDFDSGYVLDHLGSVVALGTNHLTPVYQRDAEGNPLFEFEGKYFVLSDDKEKMCQVNFNPAFGTALSFSYTSDYSETDIELYRFYVDTQETRKISVEDGSDVTDLIEKGLKIHGEDYEIPEYTLELKDVRLWGYVDKDNEEVIEAKYYFASEFNADGYAFVTRRDGSMIMIDREGEPVIDPYGDIMYLQSQDRHYIVDGYYLPDRFGSESIGMFRFDDGLLRVVRKFYDYYQIDTIVAEEDILIYRDNSKFAIPYGYDLIGYSNGILLLRKEGHYGYMDNTGRWLVQPVYQYARPFFEGLAVVTDLHGKKLMIDTDGNIVLPAVYDYISDCSDGVVTAYESAHGWSIYNKMKIDT